MIIVITEKHRNNYTGKVLDIVSHGIDVDTGRPIILPQQPIDAIGAVFDPAIGEWVLG